MKILRKMSKLFTGVPFPRHPHITLQAVDLKPKQLIIGDIHGCLHEFQDLLAKTSFDPHDTDLFLVGDLINKGPHSPGVVKLARSLGAYCVRGNHEHAALYWACAPKAEGTVRPELYNYVDELDSDDIAWLTEFPFTISLPSLNAIMVHAGLVPGMALAEQEPEDMMMMRNVLQDPETGVYRTCEQSEGVAWASAWKDGPHVYFGHDAKRLLQQYEGATGLDTGCLYGKKLTAISLPSKEITQVDAHHTYVEPMDRKVPLV